jgi:hypothetical protein
LVDLAAAFDDVRRIDRTQHGVLAHHDFIGGECDQRTARHGVVRHKDGDLGLVLSYRFGDLEYGQDEFARRVQHEVDWRIGVGHLDGVHHVFGFVDVLCSARSETKKVHRLLPVNQQDHPRLSLAFDLQNCAHPHGLEYALSQHRLKRGEDESSWKISLTGMACS